MHIVIPMSGTGLRFLACGYRNPKPLIEVDGGPMIQYVLSMFPGESRFTFICNREHLETTSLRAVLSRLAPAGTVISIEPHKKGPVWAVSRAFGEIDDEEEVIVNYCDFYSYFDYPAFLEHTRSRRAAGAVPAYRGFHPHMLGTDNYAFIREEKQWLQAIQEKKPFTENRLDEFASDGTYYFARGQYVKTYFSRLMEENIAVGGEYYVSMVFNLLVRDRLPVSVYEIQHMLQWGTAHDLEEYQSWSDCFRKLADPKQFRQLHKQLPHRECVNLIPMAGRGARFQQAGTATPKPLIKVSGKPMFVQAAGSLPSSERQIFVCLRDHLALAPLAEAIKLAFPHSSLVAIGEVTEGQASTCALGISQADPPITIDSPLLIAACDNAMIWDSDKYERLISSPDLDVVAFTFKNHPSSSRHPHMYGWIITDSSLPASDKIHGVSVKKAISDNPRNDHAIVGTFYFKKARYFLEGLQKLIDGNLRVNGEYYVDSIVGVLAEAGYDCRVFEVDNYMCWGTPDDLKTFEYWQDFFHKCSWHPYRLENDPLADSGDQQLIQRVERILTQTYR